MKLRILAILICFYGVGCTHALHMYHVSDSQVRFKKQKSKKITSSGEQATFLGFVQETNYVNEAYQGLADACPRGKVTNIHTRYSTSHGFFSWKNKVFMQATCVN